MLLRRVLLASSLLAAFAGSASAAVVGGMVTGGTSLSVGGTFVELDGSAAFSVGNDTFQDPNLYAFDEDQNIIIPSEIAVNVGTNPLSGDVVASHYVFFDPAGSRSQIGYVDFDAPIYGIATQTAELAASDFLLNNSVTYLNPTLRGLEAGDSVWIDGSLTTRLWVSWTASTPGDYVRVFTMESPSGPPPSRPSPVPLPAGAPLILTALGTLGLIRRSRAA